MNRNIKSLVKETGISQPAISNILAGRRRPSWKYAKKLAEVTSTDPALWLDGSPEEIKSALRLIYDT